VENGGKVLVLPTRLRKIQPMSLRRLSDCLTAQRMGVVLLSGLRQSKGLAQKALTDHIRQRPRFVHLRACMTTFLPLKEFERSIELTAICPAHDGLVSTQCDGTLRRSVQELKRAIRCRTPVLSLDLGQVYCFRTIQ